MGLENKGGGVLEWHITQSDGITDCETKISNKTHRDNDGGKN